MIKKLYKLPNTILGEVTTRVVPTKWQNLPVAAFISCNGEWNWDMIKPLISDTMVAEIALMPKPRAHLGADVPSWRFISDGTFTTKSAYQHLVGFQWHTNGSIWKKVWHWQGPQRICCFLWLTMSSGVMTNEFHFQCHLTHNPLCPRCDTEVETLSHMLWDCAQVRVLWERMVIPSEWLHFFSLKFIGWIRFNLSSHCGSNVSSSWNIVFGFMVWFLWLSRNEVVFWGGDREVHHLYFLATLWAQ